MAGLTDEGLTIKTYNEIVESMRASLVSKLGVQINTDPDSVIAQIYDPIADQLADMWSALLSVHQSDDPNTASGESLDRVSASVGVTRLEATKSYIEAQNFSGTNNTTVPAGSIIEVDGTLERFTLDSPVEISTAACIFAQASITTVSNNTNYQVQVEGNTYQITSDGDATAEEIAGALVSVVNADLLLSVTATDNLDGTYSLAPDDGITEILISFGPGQTVDTVTSIGLVTADNFGPIQAPAGTLANIITPIVGWDSTTNPLDAVIGRNLETDPELRIRRAQSLAISGQSTVPAIRSKIAQIIGVEAAIVIENDLEVPDVDGRPPHSFESIVVGGDDLELAGVIYENKPAGIQTYGSTSAVYVDSEGISRTIYFSRPTEIYIHLRVSYSKYDEEAFPTATGESSIAASALDTGNALTIGNDVLPERFKGPIFTAVSGIAELTVEVATSAGPLDPPGAYQTTPLAISGTEVAIFDSSRIIVQEV